MTSDDRVARARALHSPDDAVQLYATWAREYDRDVFDVLGFIGTDRVADLLAQRLTSRDTPIIDLGCGTGAAAARLVQHGYSTIDGVDISPEMLQVAAERGLYRHLMTADLTGPMTIGHRYGGSVSAGTFTTGHVGASAVPAIAALLQPGAVVAWVVAETMWPAFRDAITEAGLELLHEALEPIRRDGPPEAMMVVARTT